MVTVQKLITKSVVTTVTMVTYIINVLSVAISLNRGDIGGRW